MRLSQVCLLLRTQTQPDLACNILRYIVLDIEDVFRQIIVVLGPQVRLILHLNKLSGNAYVTSAFAQAVFQHVLHRKFASYLIQAFVLMLVSHDGRSRDHTQLFRVKPA